MFTRILLVFIFITFSYQLNSTQLTIALRSSVSNQILSPDSINVFNKSENISATFLNTNIINLGTVTSIESELQTESPIVSCSIFSYNGQLIHKSNIKSFTEIISNLKKGIYLLETIHYNSKVERKMFYLDGNNEMSSTRSISLNYLSPPLFDITIYKHGYETLIINDVSISGDETIPLILVPEFDKYYNKVTLNVKGIWKEGKVSSETTINGKQNYSTYENNVELKEDMIFSNTEIRKLDDGCYEKVMEGVNQMLECQIDFPIKEDSLYFCGLYCEKPSGSYWQLSANTLQANFNLDMDTLVSLNLNYRVGSYEDGGYPAKLQKYKNLSMVFSNIAVSEDSDKYTVTLDNTSIKEKMKYLSWGEYYDSIGFHPPHDRVKSNSSYDGIIDIKSDATIEIVIYKSK